MQPQCPICLEVFLATDTVLASKCGHTFHNRCIHQWLEGSLRRCPQCRGSTSGNELIRIYFDVTDDSTPSVSPPRSQHEVEALTRKLEETEARLELLQLSLIQQRHSHQKQLSDQIQSFQKERTSLEQTIVRLAKEATEREQLIAEKTAELKQTIKSLEEGLGPRRSTISKPEQQVSNKERGSTDFHEEFMGNLKRVLSRHGVNIQVFKEPTRKI